MRTWCESRLAFWSVVGLFLLAIALQWNGPQSVAVADEIAYITGGVNLVTTGCYTNPFGEPELWFPPVYPVAIGVLSLGGAIDPFVVARLISVAAAVATLILIERILRSLFSRVPGQPDRQVTGQLNDENPASLIPLLTVALLAANPVFQTYAHHALSESLATCLSIAALAVWLRGEPGRKRSIQTGSMVALAALTRPECLLILPLWYGLDLLLRRDLAALRQGLTAGLVCSALLLPYAAWLHHYTGKWSISNKGAVNLAAGRSAFHGTPREFINPQTLAMGFYSQDTSLPVEVDRYFYNARKLAGAFIAIYYKPVLALLVAAACLIGLQFLWKSDRRLCGGLLAMLPYLLVVCVFDVGGEKNLHAALPVFCVFAAAAFSISIVRFRRLTVIPICLLLALSVEGGTRYPRWVMTRTDVAGSELRDTGLQLRGKLEPGAVMYEHGATIGYYSHCQRRRLTPNDLNTLCRYIEKVELPTTPVYLALGESHRGFVDASVAELLETSTAGLREVYRSKGSRPVVVYEFQRPRNPRPSGPVIVQTSAPA